MVFLIAVMAAVLAACSGGGGGDDDEKEVNPFGLEVQSVASAVNPVALTFAPDGLLFFAEKYTGNIRVVDAAGNLLSEPCAHINVANWLDLDWGLTVAGNERPGRQDPACRHRRSADVRQPVRRQAGG